MAGPLKILLSEASSTSARETLYALGRLGHEIHICDPQRICLGRFSRYVRAYHRCPSFTADPLGYLEFLRDRLGREHYDVLFPVHDQVYLLSRFREDLQRRVGVALPDFAAMEQLQSKAALSRLFTELDLPQPPTTFPATIEDLGEIREFPCYVKLSYSTAGVGVWHVKDRAQMPRVIEKLQQLGPVARAQELVVQQVVKGVFHCVQAVFQQGEVVGVQAYQGRATGVGGSAHARVSVAQPLVVEHVARLGAHLHWHGAMHLEYFCDGQTQRPVYIEANPRIGETMNATLGGLNLCELLVKVSLNETLPRGLMARSGVRTHSLLMSLMAIAERDEGRGAMLRELREAWAGRGIYENSEDELTRPREDFLSLLPAVEVVGQLLVAPHSVGRTIRRAVESYSLTAEAASRIRQLPVG